MNPDDNEEGLGTLLLMAAVLAGLCMCAVWLCTGCASGAGRVMTDSVNPLRALLENGADETDPRILAALQLTRYGVLCIVAGLIFGAVTRFRSGWGLSVAAAGLGMILLAWTIQELWWLGLLTIGGYAAYKVYNRLNPNCPTEGLLE